MLNVTEFYQNASDPNILFNGITQIMLRIIWKVIKSIDIKLKFQNAYTCEVYRHSLRFCCFNLLDLVDFHLLLSHLPASSLVVSLSIWEIPDSQLQQASFFAIFSLVQSNHNTGHNHLSEKKPTYSKQLPEVHIGCFAPLADVATSHSPRNLWPSLVLVNQDSRLARN